jgi:hypothetical protein
MTETDGKITCIHCGEVLSGSHSGPCPSCGKVGKKLSVTMSDSAVVGGAASIHTQRSFYEKNKKAFIILTLITVGSPFIGFFIIGIPGLLIGLVLSVISYFLGPKAIMKVVEHRHFN